MKIVLKPEQLHLVPAIESLVGKLQWECLPGSGQDANPELTVTLQLPAATAEFAGYSNQQKFLHAAGIRFEK